MKLHRTAVLGFIVMSLAQVGHASADLRPDRIFVADSKKNDKYIRDGLITGGDQSINEVVVRDIRRAKNSGFERIVIDLEGNRNGEPTAISRPPYYQVSVTPDEKRLIFSVWGKPKVALDAKRVLASFRKSAVVQNLTLLPPVDPNVWTFVAELKGGQSVEIFELSNPVRIIVDVKTTAQNETHQAH